MGVSPFVPAALMGRSEKRLFPVGPQRATSSSALALAESSTVWPLASPPVDRICPMKRAVAFLIAGLMRKESFAGRPIEEATVDYIRSPALAARTSGITCD